MAVQQRRQRRPPQPQATAQNHGVTGACEDFLVVVGVGGVFVPAGESLLFLVRGRGEKNIDVVIIVRCDIAAVHEAAWADDHKDHEDRSGRTVTVT